MYPERGVKEWVKIKRDGRKRGRQRTRVKERGASPISLSVWSNSASMKWMDE